MAYAAETKVPVERTQAEIRALINKNGADSFALFEERDRVHVAFQLRDRRIRFSISMPARENDERAVEEQRRMKATRSRWRALLLVIKAKLESVESGIETFDEAFLAHIQMPSGRTVMEEVREPIAIAYQGNLNVPLLPGPNS